MNKLYYLTEYNVVREVNFVKKEDLLGVNLRVVDNYTGKTLILKNSDTFKTFSSAKLFALKKAFSEYISDIPFKIKYLLFCNKLQVFVDKFIQKSYKLFIPNEDKFIRKLRHSISGRMFSTDGEYICVCFRYKNYEDERWFKKENFAIELDKTKTIVYKALIQSLTSPYINLSRKLRYIRQVF